MKLTGNPINREQLDIVMRRERRLVMLRDVADTMLLLSFIAFHAVTVVFCFREIGWIVGLISIPALFVSEIGMLAISIVNHGWVNLYSMMFVGWLVFPISDNIARTFLKNTAEEATESAR